MVYPGPQTPKITPYYQKVDRALGETALPSGRIFAPVPFVPHLGPFQGWLVFSIKPGELRVKVARKRVMVAFQRKRERMPHTDRRIIKYIHMHILLYLQDLILFWEQGPPVPRLLPCEIQPAKKRKSTPPG